MKCPKCGFLGFDSGDRCKNCGYDFSLIEPGTDHLMRPTPSAPSPGELSIRDPRLVRRSRYLRDPGASGGLGADRPLAEEPDGAPVDLPLFGAEPSPLPPSRPPLAVRRPTPAPAPARIRPRPRMQPGFLSLDLAEPAAVEPAAPATDDAEAAPAASGSGEQEINAAAAGRRAMAALIDLGLLALVDLIVLHFSLTICGLTVNDLHVLPAVPMVAFLLLLNGGYLVLFTGTLGQTIGKMAAAIEVVPEGEGSMDLRRATVRSAAMIVSALPAGAGWLAGFVGEHRSLHDRLAGTRVIRVAGT
jgi:uncharacterized RDD family membrane protein YckC